MSGQAGSGVQLPDEDSDNGEIIKHGSVQPSLSTSHMLSLPHCYKPQAQHS